MGERRRRIGRRPGASGTREQILDAARTAFAESGFDGATVRDIAGRAGVDPAMIHHYFGSKEKLFQAVIDFPVDPRAELAAGEPVRDEDLGAHLVRTLLGVWDSPRGSAGLAMVRSAVRSESMAQMLREFMLAQVVRPVVARVEPDPQQAARRGALVVSQLTGLIVARYILTVEPLASASIEDVVGDVAPTVQRYLTGELADR